MFKDKAVFEAAIQEDNYKLKDGKKLLSSSNSKQNKRKLLSLSKSHEDGVITFPCCVLFKGS